MHTTLYIFLNVYSFGLFKKKSICFVKSFHYRILLEYLHQHTKSEIFVYKNQKSEIYSGLDTVSLINETLFGP